MATSITCRRNNAVLAQQFPAMVPVRLWGALADVDGEPHGRRLWVGPFHAVAGVRRDVDVVAGRKRARLSLSVEQKAGRTGKQHHPFVPVLVVPEARRARLASRDDALDANARLLDQKVELLLGLSLRQRR